MLFFLRIVQGLRPWTGRVRFLPWQAKIVSTGTMEDVVPSGVGNWRRGERLKSSWLDTGTKDQKLMKFFVNRAKIDEETLKPAVPGDDGVTPENHKNYDLNYKLWCTISACVDEAGQSTLQEC